MSSLRIVSYAINGRGMGHLVRQLAILRWVRRITTLLSVRTEIWVLTSSEADTLARREGFPAFKLPSKAMLRDAGIEPHRYLALARGWVLNAVAGLSPDLLLVDTFPGGSFGELVSVLELAKHRVLVARRVRQQFADEDPYQALLPLYERQIVPDEGGGGPILLREREELLPRDDARRQLGVTTDARTVYLTLGGGGDDAAASVLPRLTERLRTAGMHVVVGAGPLYQGPELRGDGVVWMDRYCPMELFPAFDAAVSAGGYNSFHELMFAGVPTVFMPQPRIADDQRERVHAAQKAGAGRVAERMDDIVTLLAAPGSADAARRLVPHNGAKLAALQALTDMLPAADLALADQLLGPELIGLFAGSSLKDREQGFELLRLLLGRTPSERAKHAALWLQWQEQGSPASDTAPERSEFARLLDLFRNKRVPMETAVALVNSLRRKFPAAGSGALSEALEVLLPCWGRFEDWGGVITLMRAVPTQRSLSIVEFAKRIAEWLAEEEDLFDALRDFTRVEGSGVHTVDEVLRLLLQLRRERPAGAEAHEAS
ncbi:MAG: hypothetical protein R3B13_02330 [Polyangiaceae bacterium]